MANLIDEIKQRVGATQIEMAKYVKIAPIENEDRKGWVNYGEGNSFPQYLIELYNESPIHGALVNSISYMIAGREMTASTPQAVSEIKRLSIDKIVNATALDLKLHGGFYWEVIWSMDRSTIAQVNHLPFENCRLACSDEDDSITGIWYSRDWSNIRKKKNEPRYIAMFNEEHKDALPKQVLFVHHMMVGSEYYPKPDYVGAINEIEKMRQLSEYQVNLILNGFFPSLIASFNNGIPSLEEQHMIKNQLTASIQGAENAGKVLTFFNEERDRGVEFTPFPVADMDKQFTTLVDQSIESILVSHRVTSPLLFGVRDGGGLGSNTDEMKTALRIFSRQVIDPFQRLITDATETLLASFGVVANCTIVQNDLLTDEQVSDTGTTTASVDVASQALNGAQIASLLEIIVQTTANVLTIPSAKAITKAAFPMLGDVEINNIFDNLSNVVIDPTQVVQKKKVKCEHSHVSQAEESYEPTDEMAREAELGLKWREEYGRGGTEVGVARARDISNKRNLSFDTVKRMNSYFSRHEVDKEAIGWEDGEEGFPTAGRVAWQLWGGDAGRDWAARIVEREQIDLDAIAEELIQLGEEPNEDWILIDEYDVDYAEDDSENEAISHIFDAVEIHQVSTGTAKPNATSEQDKTIDERKYYTRYRYSGQITDVTRPFCTKMLQADKLYRKEDIMAMGNKAVNPGWGPNGADTYSCWLFKGGGNCGHWWSKQLYISAKGFGLDLNNPNVRTQAWAKAEKAGYKVRNNYLVERKPIDMPYNGFLPTNPRFGNK